MNDTIDTRILPTGTWKLGDDQLWHKLCGKCGGTGYLPGYEFIDGARCWGCMRSGYAAVKPLTTEALDRKAAADEKRQAKRDAERAAKAAAAVAKWQAEEDQRLAAEAEREAAFQAQRAAAIAASNHLDAEVGEKVEVEGIVTLARNYEASGFGGRDTVTKRIIAVDLGNGVTVKAFTQARAAFALCAGDTVRLSGVVKSHGDYQGVKETTLNRPKVLDRTPANQE